MQGKLDFYSKMMQEKLKIEFNLKWQATLQFSLVPLTLRFPTRKEFRHPTAKWFCCKLWHDKDEERTCVETQRVCASWVFPDLNQCLRETNKTINFPVWTTNANERIKRKCAMCSPEFPKGFCYRESFNSTCLNFYTHKTNSNLLFQTDIQIN